MHNLHVFGESVVMLNGAALLASVNNVALVMPGDFKENG